MRQVWLVEKFHFSFYLMKYVFLWHDLLLYYSLGMVTQGYSIKKKVWAGEQYKTRGLCL